MSPRIIWELRFLGLSFLWGLWMMAAYDGLRVLRGLFPHSHLWVSLEDICYWLVCAFAVFGFLYREDDGIVRWYALFGMGVGMFVWNRTVSPVLVRFLVLIFRKLGNFLQKPVKFLCNVIKRGLQKEGK